MTAIVLSHATSIPTERLALDLDEATTLTLLACALPDLRPLAAAHRLRTLRIACSRLESLTGLEALALDTLELLFSSIGDVPPLPSVHTLRVFGVPQWDAARARSARCVEEDVVATQALARRAWNEGAALCVGQIPGDSLLVVRPGPRADRRVDYAVQWANALARERALDDGDRILAGGFRDPAAPPDEQRFACAWITGDSDDARRWIAASPHLRDADRAALETLVARFPGELYFRDTDAAIDRFEQRKDPVPAWLRTFRTTVLSSVRNPAPSVFVRLDGFDRTGAMDRTAGGWYELGLLGSRSERRAVERRARLLPIAERPSELDDESTLALSLDEDDRWVYEYSPHWLDRAAPDEPAPTERVCRSIATLWGHVVEIGTPPR